MVPDLAEENCHSNRGVGGGGGGGGGGVVFPCL